MPRNSKKRNLDQKKISYLGSASSAPALSKKIEELH
jgi:hypothetical protein